MQTQQATQTSYAVNVAQRYSAHCYNVAQTLAHLAQRKAAKAAQQKTYFVLQVKATQQYITFAQSTARYSATRTYTVQYTSSIALAARYTDATLCTAKQQLANVFSAAQLNLLTYTC